MLRDNLIFDLGAVLYEIDFSRTVTAFLALTQGASAEVIGAAVQGHPGWQEFERGNITAEAFRELVRRELKVEAPDSAIDTAWNALLVGPLAGRAEWLRKLARKHRLVLLSNTNEIHYKKLRPECTELLGHFEHLFLSFEMGYRKPEPEIYRALLDQMGWRAEDCTFFDDSAANVEAACALGIDGRWVEGKSGTGLLALLGEK